MDPATARGIVTTLAEALAPGSYLVISVGFARGQGGEEFARTYNAQGGARIYPQTWEQITALFDGLELVPPGLVDSAAWRAEWLDTVQPDRASMIVGGVGRLP